MKKVVQDIVHGPKKGGTNVIKVERHDPIGECAPWSCEVCFVLIDIMYLNLAILREDINEG